MSIENTNPGNKEDLKWKAYIQSVTEGRKYLRSTWHHNIKPGDISEFRPKEKGSEAYSSRKDSGMSDDSEGNLKIKVKETKTKSKTKTNNLKINPNPYSTEKIRGNPLDLFDSISDDYQPNNRGKITNYSMKKSSNISSDIFYTPSRVHKNETEENRYNISNNTAKIDSIKKNKKLSVHNSVLPYDIVPHVNTSCNPFLLSVSLAEKIKDNRRSHFENYVGRCVAVRGISGKSEYLLAKIEKINREKGIIQIYFINPSIEDTQGDKGRSEKINYLQRDTYLLEYMFEYSDVESGRSAENELDSIRKFYFIVISKFNSIFEESPNQADEIPQSEQSMTFYKGFVVTNSFILDKIEKVISTQLTILREDELDDPVVTNMFTHLNRNLVYFIDRSEFIEIYTNKLRSINHSAIELNKVKTNSATYKNLDILSQYILHEIVLTMNINHKTDRRFFLLLAVNKEPNNESIFVRHYKTGKNQWINLSDYKLSIRANIFKGHAVIDYLLNLRESEEIFYKILKFSNFTDRLNSYDSIVLDKVKNGVKIMKEMECDKCTYKIEEFEYRMCKICKKINHIECLPINERSKDHLLGKSYWYCKSCKPCSLCFSNIDDSSVRKRVCSSCSQCYHQECINENINVIYPNNYDEEKWKCEKCLKCQNCGITATEIVRDYLQHKNNLVQDSTTNTSGQYQSTGQVTLSSVRKNMKFSSTFDHCEHCEKRYEMRQYCPICRKLWNSNDQNMIECKCKFWVHKECDRTVSDDFFKKLKKKNYYCPNCRIRKKNKQIWNIVNELSKLDKHGYFFSPVDTNTVKNYSKIINKPMCFSFILEKVNKNVYLNDVDELVSDVLLIFQNAMTYNMPNSPVYKIAEGLYLTSNEYLETYYPNLYLMSLEYFLFDYYYEEAETESESVLKLIETSIKDKFAKHVGILNSIIQSLITKLNEYKINWQFLKDFLGSNFNCVYVRDSFQILTGGDNTQNAQYLNEENDYEMNSMISDTEKSPVVNNHTSSNRVIDVYSSSAIGYKSSRNIIEANEIISNNCTTFKNENIMQSGLQEELESRFGLSPHRVKSSENILHSRHKNGNTTNLNNTSDDNNRESSLNNKIHDEEMLMDDINDDVTNERKINKTESSNSLVKRNSLYRIELGTFGDKNNDFEILQNEEININEITTNNLANIQESYLNHETCPHSEYKNKKRHRARAKTLKSAEFQYELDTYNSNFELAIKPNNKQANSNVTHKMEISENSLDALNPAIALEEEEDDVVKIFTKLRNADPNLQYLYMNKYKRYFDDLDDPNEFKAYLDMLMCYVHVKDEKKKKHSIDKERDKEAREKQTKVKSEIHDENVSECSDDVYEEPKKISNNKKGRPNKKELNDSVELNEETGTNQKEKKRLNSRDPPINHHMKHHIKHHKPDPSQLSHQELSEINLIRSSSTSTKKLPLTNSKRPPPSNLDNSSRSKTESELFDENVNSKSLLSLPTQICFSRLDLIFEKNCYLCGSFDDINLFLTCSVCFENFHSYCISNSPLITSNIKSVKKYKWKCQNCKFCEICKETGNDNLLLYCDSCDRAVHTYCLDVKLHVVPESGWKCLSCFECINCHTTKYYQEKFPIDLNKDYSIFTKNFNYCFECGLKLFYKSFCVKCGKSDFKDCNKDLIYISNLEDYKKNEIKLNFLTKTDNPNEYKNVMMLNCNICNNMFHSNCLGFDDNNLKFYFDQFEEFNCLDCHIRKKCEDKYLEATFIKYLEVLKMSYFLMCFNKLINIILKLICKDSSIKLHSKLLKVYFKDNFSELIKDRNMCMLLELIRLDVFLLKDRHALFDEYTKKTKTTSAEVKKNINTEKKITDNILITNNSKYEKEENIFNQISNTDKYIHSSGEFMYNKLKHNVNATETQSFYGYSSENMVNNISMHSNSLNSNKNGSVYKSHVRENKNIENESDAYIEENIIRLEKLERSMLSDSLKNVKLDINHVTRVLRKHDLEKCKKVNEKMKSKNKLIFNINSINSKNIFSPSNKFLSKNISHDPIQTLIKSMVMLKRRNNQQKFNLLNMNTGLNVDNSINQVQEKDPSLVTATNNENVMMVDNVEDVGNTNTNLSKKEVDVSERKPMEHNDNPKSHKNKKKRLSLIPDKELKRELKEFFDQDEKNSIKNVNTFDDTKFVNFYNFNFEEYYKGLSASDINTDKDHNSEYTSNRIEKEIITKTLEKLEPYLRLDTFPKHMQTFLINTIINTIITLKQSLIKWLLTQMLNFSENSRSTFNKSANSLSSYLINITAQNSLFQPNFEAIVNNSSEFSEEEIFNFLDCFDPIEDSPNKQTICEFCQRKGARKISGRLLYIKNENWGHVNCILWSKGVQETSDGNLFNVLQVLNKLKQFKCQFCRKYGATICCESKKCGKYYHFICGHAKQSHFTDKKQFLCGKCASSSANVKEENFADFNTNKRYFIVKNSEYVNDHKNSQSAGNYIKSTENVNNSNQFKFIPKFLIGLVNKFGNTSVLKFIQLNQKDMNIEAIDIAAVKYFERPDIFYEDSTYNNIEEVNKNLTRENLLLYVLNEKGVTFSSLFLNKENLKEFEELLEKSKITDCFVTTDIDLSLIKENSKSEVLFKNFNGQYSLSLNISSFTNLKLEKFDFFNNQSIRRFNSNLEEFMKTNILSEEEYEWSRRVNKKYDDWMSIMNISIPFNIILKYQTSYLKTLTEYADNLTANTINNEYTQSKIKKEVKNKFEHFIHTIKAKNKMEDKLCFRFLNYMETHQQAKFVKKSLIENEADKDIKSGDKKVNKSNKQTYKNLNRTMSTNIMEMDLPLAMKFRNYKALRPRVTIGPSTIHRNGLFTTEAFQPGEIVIEYVGELITNKIADFREKEYNLKGFGDCYMFRLDADHIIDATKYGNLARFINHCCDPSCSAQANQIGDKKHIILYAKRPIKAHEEITYDYNFECEQEKIQCRCGAINCLGRLN